MFSTQQPADPASLKLGTGLSGTSPLISSMSATYKGRCSARALLQAETRALNHTKTRTTLSNKSEDEKGATSQEVGPALDSLVGVFTQIRKASDIGRGGEAIKVKSLNQLTAADLIMIPTQAQAQTANEESNAVNADLDESLFAFDYSHSSGKTLQMQVAELRQRPELLRKFQADVDESKRRQLQAERDRQNKLRLMHREMLMRSLSCNYAAKPIIENFPAHNKHLLRRGFYSPENKYLRIMRQGEELEQHIDEIYYKRDYIDTQIVMHKLQSIQKHVGKPILPQTFIRQRTELGAFIGFTSRFALLFQVATNYCEIRMNNTYMNKAAVTIQYFYRVHRDFLRYAKMKEAALRIQRMSLAFLNRRRRQRRQAALETVRHFLLGLYMKNTWSAAAIMHQNAVEVIIHELQVYKQRKLARLELIVLLLEKVDRINSFARLRDTRYAAYLKEQAREAGKKKGSDSKKAPAQQSPDSFNPSPEDVEAELLPVESLYVIARIYLNAAVQFHNHELDTFAQSCRDKEIDLPALLLLPSYACSAAMLMVARDNMPEYRVVLSEFLSTELDLLELGPRYPEEAAPSGQA